MEFRLDVMLTLGDLINKNLFGISVRNIYYYVHASVYIFSII